MNQPSVDFSQLPIAIVYDQATTAHGGAELVLRQLKQLFPNATLFTTVHNATAAAWTNNWTIKTSGLQTLYRLLPKHEWLTPFMPLAIENLSTQLTEHRVIISVSAGAAKGVITRPEQLHLCYLLTPTRYLYIESDQYLNAYGAHTLARGLGIAQPLLRYLRRWDIIAAQRPDKIITISNLVSQRTQNIYRRSADALIYPPIPETVSAQQEPLPIENYNLCISRLVWYKRVDLAIKASLVRRETLCIAGEGSHEKQLSSIAQDKAYRRNPSESIAQAMKNMTKQNKLICFLGSVTAVEKSTLFAHAKSLIMPGLEDFGLTAIEAAQQGVPSLIRQGSGVSEVLLQKTHAQHIQTDTTSAVAQALEEISQHPPSKKQLTQLAKDYTAQAFRIQFQKTVSNFWTTHHSV
ncbi:MAG: glycosyltransferase [Patescibacteria group bacterium]